jgi:ATP-dependent helicase/nuclease subunit A
VTGGEVLVADYKTGSRPPCPTAPVPQAHAGQLALYRELLREIYPGRPVRAFLIWTSGPALRELGAAEMDEALSRIKAG